METTEIYQRLTAVLRDVFDDDALVARPELAAKDIEGWDSLNNLRFMLSVQKAFGVKFSAYEIANLRSVGELVTLVDAKL